VADHHKEYRLFRISSRKSLNKQPPQINKQTNKQTNPAARTTKNNNNKSWRRELNSRFAILYDLKYSLSNRKIMA